MLEKLKNDPAVQAYIRKADCSLLALGFTEHSFPHVTKVATTARYIIETLGYSEHDCELAEIAGYLHDIGNLVNVINHVRNREALSDKFFKLPFKKIEKAYDWSYK